LWTTCAAAYDQYKTIKTFEKDIEWFNDRSRFDSTGTGIGVDSSAYKFLQNCVYWMTRQKRQVKFTVPITSNNIALDLATKISFRDTIYTDASVDSSYINGTASIVEYDIVNNNIAVTALLDPLDTVSDSFGDIIETGSQTDTIVEAGNRTDTYTEDGI
jgi:hypothetical protein